MSSVQVLTASSPDFEHKLPVIQRLARRVFEPQTAPGDYDTYPVEAPQLQLDNWRTRLNEPDAAILYVCDDPSSKPSTNDFRGVAGRETIRNDRVLAFLLTNPRAFSELDHTFNKLSYHIYLAAVDPSARGQGLFPLLINTAKDIAIKSRYGVLTIGTIPSMFPRMYEILSRQDSGWEPVEWKEDNGLRKVVMKTKLS